jgi:N-acetyl-gamma-glutamyl-phosphate reductase
MDCVVIGASGYSGGQLLSLIHKHPKLNLKAAIAHTKVGSPISREHGFLTGIYDQNFHELDPKLISDTDVVFIALPHGESAGIVKNLDPQTKVIDLGADFRLRDKHKWEKYYDKEYAGNWPYGLPEIKGNRELISKAIRVANPGCYATAITLALSPLIEQDLIDVNFITVVAASGTTGAGKKANQNLLASEVMGSLTNYKMSGSHQHIPEIEQSLSGIKNQEIKINFNPILAPMPRGILANSISVLKKNHSESEITSVFQAYFAESKFVKISTHNEIKTGDVIGSNDVHLKISIDKNTNQITVISVLDNLIKGASGQAIQNLNIMNGDPEDLGFI